MSVDYSHQHAAIGLTISFTVVGTIFVILRIWSRLLANRRLFLDDWLIVVACVLVISETVTGTFYIKKNHVGIHFADIPPQTPEDLKRGQIWNYANQLLYNPILSLIKVSVLVFLLRLESRSRVVRFMIFGTMYFTILLAIAILITDIFQCTPVAYVYDTTIPGGHCIEQGAFFVATATLTIFTDLLVVIIPMIIVYSLQMPIRRKLMVVGILGLGLVATGVGAWRLSQLVQAFFPTSVNLDWTYSIGFVSSAIETNVAVVSACCPALKSLLTHFAPRFLGTSGRGTYGKSSNTRYGHGTYIRSNADPNDSYELGQKKYHNKQQTETSGGDIDSGRLPQRSKTAESLSLSDDDGIIAGAMGSIGIVKTTDVSVQRDRRDERLEKASSVDRLV